MSRISGRASWASPEALRRIAAVAKAYRVYYAKAGKHRPRDYLMDHSSIIYLMGPDGRYVKHFTYTADAPGLARDLNAALTVSP